MIWSPQWNTNQDGDPVRGWYTSEEAVLQRQVWAKQGLRVVFTNGCFDLLHRGHITYLEEARLLGEKLLVAINSDASVRRLKGPERPITPEAERAEVLAALECVDGVVIFDQETPREIITSLLPNVLVKGGDWALDQIVGRQEVEAAGGLVLNLPVVEGWSTSAIIEHILRTG